MRACLEKLRGHRKVDIKMGSGYSDGFSTPKSIAHQIFPNLMDPVADIFTWDKAERSSQNTTRLTLRLIRLAQANQMPSAHRRNHILKMRVERSRF